jgi:ketosteroid isomerase-like protein
MTTPLLSTHFSNHTFFMKNIILFAALICAALTSPCLSAQDLNAEMMALGNAWKAALERGDAAAIAALYTEEVIYVNSKDGSETTRTRAEIEADMKKTLEAKTGTLEFAPGSTATLLPNGKVSIKGEFTQTMTDKKTGEKQVFNGLFDHQVIKENGQWKFCLVKVTRKG